MGANRAWTWTRGDFLGIFRALLHATCKENHGIHPQTQPEMLGASPFLEGCCVMFTTAAASVVRSLCFCTMLMPPFLCCWLQGKKLKCQNILFLLGIRSYDHWSVMLLPFLSCSLPFSLRPPVPTSPHTDVPTPLQSGRALNRKREVPCLISAFIFS